MIYIIDTSAIIEDPYIYKCFPNSKIIIPIAVLNELDSVKKHAGSAGKSARVVIKLLDDLSNKGDISKGIPLENGTVLVVETTCYNKENADYYSFGDPEYGDTQILICAFENSRINGDTTLVSNDINLRIKAKSRGINAISQEKDGLHVYDIYSGHTTVCNEEAGKSLASEGYIIPSTFSQISQLKLHSQECVAFESNAKSTISLGRCKSDRIELIKPQYPWGIKARNKEQSFAMDLMCDRNIDLITLIGKAGCGKTFCTMATALELVLNKKQYNKLVIYRPIQPVGNDIGYMPGEKGAKMEPWFQAIFDNFEVLLSTQGHAKEWKRTLEQYQKKGDIELDVLTYIRGRSISNALIIFDEAQNLTKEQVKAILTRAGEGSKIILTGDIEQIDNSYLDATNNGLTYVVEKFKNLNFAGHVTFTKGERSRLATKASEIL